MTEKLGEGMARGPPQASCSITLSAAAATDSGPHDTQKLGEGMAKDSGPHDTEKLGEGMARGTFSKVDVAAGVECLRAVRALPDDIDEMTTALSGWRYTRDSIVGAVNGWVCNVEKRCVFQI
ncbi:hypothetical protein KP509_24G052700 [Ceratopteris richardii]|uniref:Uncharacterized protein n=1 Tax=Ceratopteris richardii TaxID=49495 RepID=A0A8T2RV12_CERRI|nr:hypothetical protein KP509_24G052700 [Ceratopteris richardii]